MNVVFQDWIIFVIAVAIVVGGLGLIARISYRR